MAGMRVVVTRCDEEGNVDLADLKAKCEQHGARLACVMITYPSTYGVFDTHVKELCALVHRHGGRVYVDGANMNALVGVAAPGEFGGDVSHLNLHKTFCIPHGGGGPGVGPVCVVEDLVPYLPAHRAGGVGTADTQIGAVSAAPLGNAAVLPISWMYVRMMGADGLKAATETAILHAPTLSFPVAGTLMVEPTESEPLKEIDRFCDAMVAIRDEIRRVENSAWPREDNPLKSAPHTAEALLEADWPHAYSREEAAFPLKGLRQQKYWSPVGRVDNVYGDRNLFCSCVPLAAYED